MLCLLWVCLEQEMKKLKCLFCEKELAKGSRNRFPFCNEDHRKKYYKKLTQDLEMRPCKLPPYLKPYLKSPKHTTPFLNQIIITKVMSKSLRYELANQMKILELKQGDIIRVCIDVVKRVRYPKLTKGK